MNEGSIGMLWIAVCDDEVIECSKLAGKIRKILEEMNVSCTIRQFYSGRELLRSLETFDLIFLDIIMDGLDGMRTAQLVRRGPLTNCLFLYPPAGIMCLMPTMWRRFSIC